MANEEHLAILQKGVSVWNKWREENPDIIPDLQGIYYVVGSLSFAGINFKGANLRETTFRGTEFEPGSSLRGLNFRGVVFKEGDFSDADLSGADLTGADFSDANFTRAKLYRAMLFRSVFPRANLYAADLTEANLTQAELIQANLLSSQLVNANLSGAGLTAVQAIFTDFESAILTGVCLEDWHTNSKTNLNGVVCNYVYLKNNLEERRPLKGFFAPGEFTQLFQKSLETLDLIFRNGVNWDAFAYSFKKLEIENQDAKLDVQSIEKKGDGVLLVRVSISPNADKENIHSNLMKGYDLAFKALEARIEDQNKIINSLILSLDKANDNPKKVSNYYFNNPNFNGGLTDADRIYINQAIENISDTDKLD